MTLSLHLGTLLPSVTRIRGGQCNPVWRGRALTDSGEIVSVYVKRLASAALLAECVGSLLARACGLGSPRPILLHDPQQLIGLADGLPLFGLEDAHHQSMRQWIEDTEDVAVQEALMGWRKLRECCVLDEILANIDRHGGNLLWDGDQEFIPIDHDFCLGGPLRHPIHPVRWDETVRNQLADRLYQHYGHTLEAGRLEKAARDAAATWCRIHLRDLIPADTVGKLSTTQPLDDVLGLIATRLEHAEALLRQRGRDYQQTTLDLPES